MFRFVLFVGAITFLALLFILFILRWVKPIFNKAKKDEKKLHDKFSEAIDPKEDGQETTKSKKVEVLKK